MRRIAAVVAALMLPMQVHALGVNDIEWKSALNQPLDAEIGLFAVGTTNQHDINVKLAPYEAYERAGIEYPSVLRDLKFSVERRQNGELYIKLTSDNSIKDPFLDILIEVDWPSGHLLREFTVLLDLPVMTDEVAGPVSSPMTSPMADMAQGSMAPASVAATRPADSGTMAAGDQAASGGAPMPAGPIYGESAARQGADGLRYGMVKRGDTLWGIAESMRTDKSVSVQQIMMALLKNNPEAFYDNNINNLKAGYVLRLDDPSSLTEMSQSEASREAQRHYQSWLAKKKGGALSTAQAESAQTGTTVGGGAEKGTGVPTLKLVSPDDAEVAMATKTAGGDSQARSFTGEELDSLRQELAYAMESSDAGREENTQLHARIAELEEQIGEMQRLLSLRDDALSVLQIKPKDQGAAATQAEGQAAVETKPEIPEAVAPAAGPDIAPMAAMQEQQPAAEIDQSAASQTPESAAKPVEQAPMPAKPVKKPAKPAPAAEKGIVDTILGYVNKAVAAAGSLLNPMVLAGVVGGALLLGGGFWFIRKRRISGDDLEQSMMIEVADKQLSEDMANGTVSDLSESREETSAVDLLDTASGDSIDAADIDEIDVLAEADVYLAYQRFDRAEELLRDAVEHEPQRHDLMLKLMEVFVASNNKDGFIEIASRCDANGGKQDAALWKKVTAMASKIAPGHPLFSGAAAAADADEDDEDVDSDLPGGDLGVDFGSLDDDMMGGDDAGSKDASIKNLSDELGDLDFGDDDQQGMDVEAGKAELDGDDGLDFDGGLDMSNDPADMAPPKSAFDTPADDNSLSFDSDDLSPGGGSVKSGSLDDGLDAGLAADNGLEFDGGLNADLADDSVPEMAGSLAADDNALEFDATGLSLDSEEPAATATDAMEDASGLEFDSDALETATGEDEGPVLTEVEDDSSISDDLSEDIDWLTSVVDDAADNDDNSSSFFSSEDEVATKLDLIRAYIDMGDNDSARNILSEVVEEGSDDQKQEAQDLLRQIG